VSGFKATNPGWDDSTFVAQEPKEVFPVHNIEEAFAQDLVDRLEIVVQSGEVEIEDSNSFLVDDEIVLIAFSRIGCLTGFRTLRAEEEGYGPVA